MVIIYILTFIFLYSAMNYITFNKYKEKYEEAIRTLYRQTARWGVASAQDESELIRVLHANYATGYLWALKDIISTAEFKTITGQEFLEFEKKIVSIQDKATLLLVNKCNELTQNKDPLLLSAIYKADI